MVRLVRLTYDKVLAFISKEEKREFTSSEFSSEDLFSIN